MTKSNGNASDPQRKLAAALPPDEPVAGSPRQPESIPPRTLLAQVLDRENLRRALKQVRRNKGAPGIRAQLTRGGAGDGERDTPGK